MFTNKRYALSLTEFALSLTEPEEPAGAPWGMVKCTVTLVTPAGSINGVDLLCPQSLPKQISTCQSWGS